MFFPKELENWKNHVVPSWIVDMLQSLYFQTSILEITESRKEEEESNEEEK